MTDVMLRTTAPTYQLGSVSIESRGALSDAILGALTGDGKRADEIVALAEVAGEEEAAVQDDDIQLSLFVLYTLSYGSLGQHGAEWEWDTRLIKVRTILERAFEAAVRRQVGAFAVPTARSADIADALFEMTKPTPGPSLSRYIARLADAAQTR